MSQRSITIQRLLEKHSKQVLPAVDSERGEQIPAICPFHKGGDEQQASFYWNTESGLFCCLACGISGGMYDFLTEAGYSKKEAKAVLEEIRRVDGDYVRLPSSPFRRSKADLLQINPIIPDWYLETFNYKPKRLVDEGYDDHLLKTYGVGYDILRSKITFPIRDIFGNLIGISGRVDGQYEDEKVSKYKFYRTELEDIIEGYRLEKSVTFWNGYRLWARYVTSYHAFQARPLIVLVEGFKAALHMIRLGYTDTIALMGTSMSAVQRYILSTIGGDVLIFLDNNEPGRRGSEKIYKDLRENSATRPYLLHYPPECTSKTQPDDLTSTQIDLIITETYG